MSQKERYWQQLESNHVHPERIQAINAALEDASRRLLKLEQEKKQVRMLYSMKQHIADMF